MSVRPKCYFLKHADGRFYSFTDQATYDGPQFSKDYRDAKLMSRQGAANVQRRLLDPRWHGERFEIIHETEAAMPR